MKIRPEEVELKSEDAESDGRTYKQPKFWIWDEASSSWHEVTYDEWMAMSEAAQQVEPVEREYKP